MIGLVVAFVGIAGVQFLEIPELDGVASVGIGIVLAASTSLGIISKSGIIAILGISVNSHRHEVKKCNKDFSGQANRQSAPGENLFSTL